MMIKTVLLLLTATTEAFVPLQTFQARVVLKAAATTTDDDTLARLQHEYKVLQEKLLADLTITHDSEDAIDIEEDMLEVAAQATMVQEHKQLDIIEQAEEEMHEAEGELMLAQKLKEMRLEDAFEEGDMNAAFEDLESYNILEESFVLQELEAKKKIDAARILLDNLEENEFKLVAMLKQLKEEKAHLKEDAVQREASRHRSFLDQVKDAIYSHPDLLVSLDPHIL